MSISSRLAQWVVRIFVSDERRGSTPLPGTDSIATPLGHKSYRDVNLDASLDEGVERARNRNYVPFGEEMSDAEDEAFWRDHPELARFRHVRGDE